MKIFKIILGLFFLAAVIIGYNAFMSYREAGKDVIEKAVIKKEAVEKPENKEEKCNKARVAHEEASAAYDKADAELVRANEAKYNRGAFNSNAISDYNKAAEDVKRLVADMIRTKDEISKYCD